ncbi:MAG: Pyruvate kinase, alpha/beta domain [Candidatus Bathyarchaeota archaeon BA2]|nr:MAG: Pyruvate kinase, alpha/beta domain [Candidatus Bathyarchaeota archaeon BA2]
MKSVERKTVYFQAPGEQNTESILELVKDYAQAEGIRDIVVASTTGETGVKASRVFKGFNVVVVSHHVGFHEPGVWELKEDNRKKILENGAKILTATHALSGVERAVRKKFGTVMLLELVAHTLRLFGEGTKVCVEITVMAADAGLIPVDRDVIAIGGTGRGADTALVIRPASASRFFDLEIREIIAKPRSI